MGARVRRWRVAAVAAVLAVAVVAPAQPPAQAATGFTDLDRTIHDDDIERVVVAGLAAGCTPTAFCPTAPVTRAQLATFLAAALQLGPRWAPFDDVPADGTHAGAIGALAAAGITGGCAPELFCPNEPVTRAQLASLLMRAYDLPPGPVDAFEDVDRGSPHAAGIGAVAAADITRGCDSSGSLFCPARRVPRDQLAALLSRTLRLGADGCRPLAPGTTRTDLGTVAPGFPVNAAVRIGDVLYVASLSLAPSRVVGYDLRTGDVIQQVRLPTGSRTWALEADGPLLYIGQWGVTGDRTNWYRYDTRFDFLAEIGSIRTEGEFWDLTIAEDRSVYAATAVPNTLYRYQLGARNIETLTFPGPEEEVTQVVASDGELVVGTGRGRAHLLVVDPATMGTRELTTGPMEDAFGVYDLVVTEDRIVVGLGRDPGALVVLDRADGAVLAAREFPDEHAIGGLSIDGDVVHFAGVRTGRLYRWELGALSPEEIGRPVPWSPIRATFVAGDELVGVSASPLIWRLPRTGGEVAYDDLVASGAEAGLEASQSLAATDELVLTGMNNAVQARSLDDPGTIRRRAVPGEVKAMLPVGDHIYLATYPTAELWRYDATTDRVEPHADWDDVQDRPTQIAYDASRDRLLVATQSDFAGGGGLVSVRRFSGRSELWTDPLGPEVAVHSVEAADGVAYLGGGGEDAAVAAVDPFTREELWHLVPEPGAGPVTDLELYDGQLHGITRGGWWFVLDPEHGTILRLVRVLNEVSGELAVRDGELLVIGRDRLVRIDPDEGMAYVLAGGLSASVHGRPRVQLSGCRVVVETGQVLVSIDADPRRR